MPKRPTQIPLILRNLKIIPDRNLEGTLATVARISFVEVIAPNEDHGEMGLVKVLTHDHGVCDVYLKNQEWPEFLAAYDISDPQELVGKYALFFQNHAQYWQAFAPLPENQFTPKIKRFPPR